MYLEIIKPDTNVFTGDVDSLVVPAVDGLMGILNNHAPIIAALKEGDITINANGKEQKFKTQGGVLEVLNNKAIILAE